MNGDRRSEFPLRHIRGPHDFATTFNVGRETIARLEHYEALLRQWQKVVNLVAASTLDDIWHRHFADAAQLLPMVGTARSFLDLGSGGGFPGLVIAILLADADGASGAFRGQRAVPAGGQPRVQAEGLRRITLVESNARKCAFLGEVVRRTDIAPRIAVDILSTRIEAAATQASLRGAEVISARALAPLDKLLDMAAPLFSPGSVGVFLKGRDVAAELEVAQKMWNFQVELVPSRIEPDAHIVLVRHPAAKGKAPRDRRIAKG